MLAIALAATVASATYQRVGPLQEATGYACGAHDPPAPCRIPVLGGGWPVAYLVDKTGISVEGKLSPVEDEMRWSAFVLDFAFFVGLTAGLAFIGGRRRGKGAAPLPEHRSG
ncbi:MAG TPA: hypothetical protein VFS20_23420 [Longimicrobium sp.]|nr:hypothetical protein [Longimicrobium sp.]